MNEQNHRLGRNPFEKKSNPAPMPSAVPEIVSEIAPVAPITKNESLTAQPRVKKAPSSKRTSDLPSETKPAPASKPKSESVHEWKAAKHWVLVELPAELMMLGLETAITVSRGLGRLRADRREKKNPGRSA